MMIRYPRLAVLAFIALTANCASDGILAPRVSGTYPLRLVALLDETVVPVPSTIAVGGQDSLRFVGGEFHLTVSSLTASCGWTAEYVRQAVHGADASLPQTVRTSRPCDIRSQEGGRMVLDLCGDRFAPGTEICTAIIARDTVYYDRFTFAR